MARRPGVKVIIQLRIPRVRVHDGKAGGRELTQNGLLESQSRHVSSQSFLPREFLQPGNQASE